MTRLRTGFLVATLALFGCDHHKPTDLVQSDPAYTGLGTNAPAAAKPVIYPRAVAVSLPPASSPPTAPPPSPEVKAPATLPPPAAPTSVAATVSSRESSTPPALPSPMPDAATNGAPPDSTPPPPAPDTNPDMARLAVNPTTPTVVTNPPDALDEAEANRKVVVLETSLGRMVIELDDVAAPRTCGNFRKLVSDGFYNHTIFHRVIPNFIIQGGDPITKTDDRVNYGDGDPGYTLPAEIKLKAVAGAVAMARLPDSTNPQRDSNGSQFFICVADCPSLNDQYTVFGHVISGMPTAVKIANQPRDKRDDPVDRIEMQASIETKKQALAESSAGQ